MGAQGQQLSRVCPAVCPGLPCLEAFLPCIKQKVTKMTRAFLKGGRDGLRPVTSLDTMQHR